ncbi:hypothetical protein HJFPF1_11967 [Paramyrothecium foliicola]|nr:hypothetical protein HJFPF1_11967 [Paramyrothecium foliicola]
MQGMNKGSNGSTGHAPAWDGKLHRMAFSSGIGLVITTMWTIMRVYSRRLNKSRFYAEDYAYFLGQLFYFGLCGCAIALVAVGPPISKTIVSVKMTLMFPMRLCYAMTLFFVKLSVILLIRRIFSRMSRAVRIGSMIALILSICWAAYASIIEFVICMPVSSSWDPSVPKEKCINHKVAYGIIPAWDIPIELLILILPIKPILALQIPKPHKIALLCVFCAGLM